MVSTRFFLGCVRYDRARALLPDPAFVDETDRRTRAGGEDRPYCSQMGNVDQIIFVLLPHTANNHGRCRLDSLTDPGVVGSQTYGISPLPRHSPESVDYPPHRFSTVVTLQLTTPARTAHRWIMSTRLFLYLLPHPANNHGRCRLDSFTDPGVVGSQAYGISPLPTITRHSPERVDYPPFRHPIASLPSLPFS